MSCAPTPEHKELIMIVVRNIDTNKVIATFAHRCDAEAFMSLGNNRNIFTIEQ